MNGEGAGKIIAGVVVKIKFNYSHLKDLFRLGSGQHGGYTSAELAERLVGLLPDKNVSYSSTGGRESNYELRITKALPDVEPSDLWKIAVNCDLGKLHDIRTGPLMQFKYHNSDEGPTIHPYLAMRGQFHLSPTCKRHESEEWLYRTYNELVQQAQRRDDRFKPL